MQPTSSFLYDDDSPPASFVEQYTTFDDDDVDLNLPREMPTPAHSDPHGLRSGSPLRAVSERHDSPFDTPTNRRKRMTAAPLDSGMSPQPPVRNFGSRLSVRSAHNNVPDAEERPLVPILVHLRTNVVVKDEFKLVTGLSSALGLLYSCPKDAIMINVDHSVCLMLGTSFDPAYFLHIQTLPSNLDPQANLLATTELQPLIQRLLKVPPSRGIIRFQPISPDFISISGLTISHLPLAAPPSRALSVPPPQTNNNNPLLPPQHAAQDILLDQIAGLSESGSTRGISPSPAAPPSRRAYSPTRDWHGPAAARRYRSENLQNDDDDDGDDDDGDGESSVVSVSEAGSAAEPPPPIAQNARAQGAKRRSFLGMLRRG